MADNTELIAPNGGALWGTSEMVSAAAGVRWTDDTPCGYDHDGGSEVFWDGMTTQTIDGVSLFTDRDSGEDWLQHHLIPADAEPLSDATLELIAGELRLGEALEAQNKARAAIEVIADTTSGSFMMLWQNAKITTDALQAAYRTYRDMVKATIAAELAAQEPGDDPDYDDDGNLRAGVDNA